jgi:hypothetical protein
MAEAPYTLEMTYVKLGKIVTEPINCGHSDPDKAKKFAKEKWRLMGQDARWAKLWCNSPTRRSRVIWNKP